MHEPDYVTVRQASEHLDVPIDTVRARTRQCVLNEQPQPFARLPGDLVGLGARRLMSTDLRELEAWNGTYVN